MESSQDVEASCYYINSQGVFLYNETESNQRGYRHVVYIIC